MAQPETFKHGGETLKVEDVLNPWLQRKDDALKERAPFMAQIKINRMFAANKQHLDVNWRDGRVIEVRTRMMAGVVTQMVTSDRLGQYLLTAVGRMAGNDYRPNFLSATEDENAAQITAQMNDEFGWGWENEWQGDKRVMAVLRTLVIDGTSIVRARYDRKVGELLGDVPIKDGQALSGKEARDYVAEAREKGITVPMATVRSGKVAWELGTLENYLWPAGLSDPDEFPWEIVMRPVFVRDLKVRYGEMADGVEEENLESTATPDSTQEKPKLKGRAMVYTAYKRPDGEHKNGCTVMFTDTNLLDYYESLPINDEIRGPRSGVHPFRWQILPDRFPGKAFIEGGIGPQKIRNKRETQIDTIIDRNMPRTYIEEQSLARPKTGEPMEIIEVRAGSPLPQDKQGIPPGAWMLQDIKLQDENIESALGMRGITLGTPPQGVSAYSAMALLTENDSLKLDPIAQELRRSFVELSWDTMELMRKWPKDKRMDIAGPNGMLRALLFEKSDIPKRYMVSAPRQGALPRSQAAELQKINDVWAAAMASGKPLPLEWYVASLNAGKMQELPASIGNVSRHKAELENIVMFHSLEAVPVSEEDDDQAHAEIHGAFKQQVDAMVAAGDEKSVKLSGVLEQHRKMHLESAQKKAQTGGQGGAPPQPPVNPTGGPNVTGGLQGPRPGGGGGSGRPPSPGGISLPDAGKLPNA